jgi:hypothetical protein
MSLLKVTNITDTSGSGSAYAKGHVVQVVSASLNTASISTATSFTSIGLTASITPSSSSSKILVSASVACSFAGVDSLRRANLSLFRGATNLSTPAAAGSRSGGFGAPRNAAGAAEMTVVSPSFLDSPSSTSALTYSVQIRVESGDTFYVNRALSDSDNALFPRGTSTITLMEIAQ